MTAKNKRRIPSDFSTDARDKAREFHHIPLEEAKGIIASNRLNSISPDYWDAVLGYVQEYHQNKKSRETETDEYYMGLMTEYERNTAARIIQDLFPNKDHAFKECAKHISYAKTAQVRRFWMYIRRELNKLYERGDAE